MNTSKRKSRRSKNPFAGFKSPRQFFLSAVVGLIFLSFYYVTETVSEVRFPAANQPAELYANQARDDLKRTIVSGIKEAKQSVLFIIYALTDNAVITALREKGESGVPVKVICDAVASPEIIKNVGPKVEVLRRIGKGHMHQKILVVDNAKVWIGSANMTGESLRMHGNLITGFESHELAARIKEKADTMSEYKAGPPFLHRNFSIGGQNVELWFFPDDVHGVQRLVDLIRSAKKTVRVAMFTWTRRDLAQEIIDAKRRGVKAEVVIDRGTSKGASAIIVKLLQKEGVTTKLSKGNVLFHHKFLYIDEKILVNGSANWTKRAFTENDDCFIILHDLTEKQKNQMNSLWGIIMAEAA
jgi:phosphatidylserine/phosphatidylglycerophosphate/cardiolipin synthase-like enzyme